MNFLIKTVFRKKKIKKIVCIQLFKYQSLFNDTKTLNNTTQMLAKQKAFFVFFYCLNV